MSAKNNNIIINDTIPNTINDNLQINDDIIQIILRQTTYTSKEAIEKLKVHNNNYIDVINEYINPKNKSTLFLNSTKPSLNQQIYTEIRKFLDNPNDGSK